MKPKPFSDATPATVLVEYIGPGGQESPAQGELVPGELYQWDRAMAAYLCTQHPDYWRRPEAATPAAPSSKE